MLGLVNLQITVHQSLAGRVLQCRLSRTDWPYCNQPISNNNKKKRKKKEKKEKSLCCISIGSVGAHHHTHNHPIRRQPIVLRISTALVTACTSSRAPHPTATGECMPHLNQRTKTGGGDAHLSSAGKHKPRAIVSWSETQPMLYLNLAGCTKSSGA